MNKDVDSMGGGFGRVSMLLWERRPRREVFRRQNVNST